ncbi:DUF5803 family protein [Halalkalicoccus jeotgali]|uniref:Lipoprotein n=1 Tax=Halalkalicoccus jeotgali (strain DSM 18796 / CECT 7217 / JCM 14584 / KCTC 4019 / B3) TaxID=795797 RepID=D8J5F2_HALJB|nr:DUF5803 family protein [Halalkalicoccus jeotgali]ADJ15648.1 hypothetical protein HacjB3_11325 [Halalkalicoccus jeotgali B3]ELY36582.1 hypothetical protein C497_11323 [Halalkalicoccus jeotgali B3]
MNRRLLAFVSLVALVTLAGCAGFGSTTSEEGLNEEASYDWDTDADATINVSGGEYQAVYTVENRSSIRLYESTRYGDDNPIDVRAVQFRYPDGTVVGTEEIDVQETRSGVTIELPAENGQLAFTSETQSNNFATETFVEGSYEVILPPGYRIDNFVLANVRPGGYESETVDDRVHIRWDEMNASVISVRYYLERDVYLFGGLIVVASIGAIIAGAYVYRQMQELRRKREEAGLDVDIEEDDRKPPPGMQ